MVMKRLFRMGLPMAMQSLITSIGGLIVVNRINQYDLTFLAGYTSAVKLYGLLEIPSKQLMTYPVKYVMITL